MNQKNINETSKQIILFLKHLLRVNEEYMGKSLIEEFLKAIESEENKEIYLRAKEKIIILNELKKDMKDINRNIIFFYKYEYFEANINYKFYGVLCSDENNLKKISFTLTNGIEEDLISEPGFEKLNIKCYSIYQNSQKDKLELLRKEQVYELIGKENYDKLTERFLKEENLLLKNAIYKVY